MEDMYEKWMDSLEKEKRNGIRALNQHNFNYILEAGNLRVQDLLSRHSAWTIEMHDSETVAKGRGASQSLFISEKWADKCNEQSLSLPAKTKSIQVRFTSGKIPASVWRKFDSSEWWITLDPRAELILISSNRAIKSIKTSDGKQVEFKWRWDN